MKKHIIFSIFFLSAILFIGCQHGCNTNKSLDQQSKDTPLITIVRFDNDLLKVDTSTIPSDHFKKMSLKYDWFYSGFCENTLRIPFNPDYPYFENDMKTFVSDWGIQKLKADVDSVFSDMSTIEKELSVGMKNLKTFFPNERVPVFASIISQFGDANAFYFNDSIIAIGLDLYLGSTYNAYRFPQFNLPEYSIKKMRKEYIAPDVIKSIAISKFEGQLNENSFLSHLLFDGKLKYFTKQLLPYLSDTLLFGYSAKQLKWCIENEADIWTHFIDKKLLFNQNPNEYMRYLNDGPFTSAPDVPQESAPSIAVFIGYQIIKQYAEQNNLSLSEVMQENNWEKILRESKYRPK